MNKIERIITEYKKRRTNRLLQRADSARYDYDRPTDDYDWITIGGQHTPIDDGHIVGGIGGKFKGKQYTGSKMQQSKKRLARLAEMAKSTANGVRRVALRMTNAAVKISKAQSISEVKDIFQKEFGLQAKKDPSDWRSEDITDDFAFDEVRSGFVGLSDMMTEFPEIRNYITSVGAYHSGIACHLAYGDGHSTLNFNPAFFTKRNISKLHKAIEDSVAGKWWPKNASPASIMAHEAGHGLQYLLARAKGQSAPTYCSGIVRKAIANVQKAGFGKDKDAKWMRGTISGQARDRNTKETVAEAFADVYANGEDASPLSVEIHRLMTEDYNKYFGTKKKEDVGDPSTWAQIKL